MQSINEIGTYFNTISCVLKDFLNVIYVEHSNSYLHVLITILFTVIILTNLHIKLIHKRLNDMNKRYTVLLLTIQQYCVSMNRAINELIELDKENTHQLLSQNEKILERIRMMHTRVKSAYTGFFRHLDITKIKRAPKRNDKGKSIQNQSEKDDHDKLMREVIDEMIATEFSSKR